jgi:hypothetical protein
LCLSFRIKKNINQELFHFFSNWLQRLVYGK